MKKRFLSLVLALALVAACLPISASAATVTERESNDTVGTAQSISLGSTVSGDISTNDDVDFYKFVLSNSGRVNIDYTAYSQYYSLFVYDENGNQVWYTNGHEWNESVGFQNGFFGIDLEAGVYYLKTTGERISVVKSSGAYSFEMTFSSANANHSEPNNSLAQASKVSFGEQVYGLIACNDEYDFFAFSLVNSERVQINHIAYSQYYSLFIYDSRGNQIWYTNGHVWDESTGFQNGKFDIDLEKGTYYLKVTAERISTHKSTGKYSFIITKDTFDIPTDPSDPDEPDEPEVIHVTRIDISPSATTIEVGETVKLRATVYPSNATYKDVTWVSLNPSIATVSSDGTVKGVSVGAATIHACADNGEFKMACLVDVQAKSSTSFPDVPSGSYYYNAVQWASENNIVTGYSDGTFGPNRSCTRAEFVFIPWRAAGSPSTSGSTRFTDVSSNAWYASAVSWAVQNGVTSGTGNGKFSPNQTCTRGQIVTFLYRYAGSPSVSGSGSFSDVSSKQYYYKAVSWAVKNDITSGTGNGKFSPNSVCTRAQVVTFLYRDMA